MLSSWDAVVPTLACVLPGWCALAGYRLAQRQPLPDRGFADGMASLVLSVLWAAATSVAGIAVPSVGDAPAETARAAAEIAAFFSGPFAIGGAVGWARGRCGVPVAVLLDDGTLVEGYAASGSLSDAATTCRVREARVATPDGATRMAGSLELSRGDVRMIRRRRRVSRPA